MVAVRRAAALFLYLFPAASASVASLGRRQQSEEPPQNPFASIPPSDDLHWVSCYPESEAAKAAVVECARLYAPLDHNQPGDAQVTLAIVKVSANVTAPEDRLGQRVVLTNPGGPGEDSIEYVLENAATLLALIGEGNAIGAISPRAVGSTLPAVACYRDQETRLRREEENLSDYPGYSERSAGRINSFVTAFAAECTQTSADMLAHVGTVATARDHFYFLEKYGQDKLWFIGISYGTVLAAVMCQMHPEKCERVLADSAVDSNNWFSADPRPEPIVGDADAAFEDFIRSCDAAGPEKCGFWYEGGPEAIRERWQEADQKILEQPLPVPQLGSIDYPFWRRAIFNSLLAPNRAWPILSRVFGEVLNFTAGEAVALAVEALGGVDIAEAPLVDPNSGLSNGPEALRVIECSDAGDRGCVHTLKDIEKMYKEYASVGEMARNMAIVEHFCKVYSVRAKERPQLPFENIQTFHPMLWVGGTADAITPVRNGINMAIAFNSRLLTIRASGHTLANIDPKGVCSEQYVRAYFTDGTLPPEGTVCHPKQDPFGVDAME